MPRFPLPVLSNDRTGRNWPGGGGTAGSLPCAPSRPGERLARGIAAALSDDPNMIEAYLSGDAYLAFAKQAHAVPENATKETHRSVRDQFKQCVLGVQYGIGDAALGVRIGQLPKHSVNSEVCFRGCAPKAFAFAAQLFE